MDSLRQARVWLSQGSRLTHRAIRESLWLYSIQLALPRFSMRSEGQSVPLREIKVRRILEGVIPKGEPVVDPEKWGGMEWEVVVAGVMGAVVTSCGVFSDSLVKVPTM